MNSEEGMSLAKMAVAVLLVVLVIGAVVALVYTAYSWFNSGSDKLSDQVNSIDASSYSQYDDNQCSGTDVLTALKTYRDSDIAIFIANASSDCTAYNPNIADKAVVNCFNYCGLAKDAEAGKVFKGVKYVSGRFTVPGMQWNDSTGLTERNTNFSPTTSKSKKSQYVKQGGQFYSNLVYDESTDEVCGILFRQMGGGTSSDPAPGGGEEPTT